jgi:hypothetical protein
MKTIIEMARVAGVRDDGHRFEFSEYKYLERFAALVAAASAAAEREACAQLIESLFILDDAVSEFTAKAIRARGNT